ncbi:hypothetical protein EIP86_010653 [Pleurotus ostreatoroseus]|nr:hypothetical protein EIP86_010653 [Pleurotus ostreatoroseus]
MVLFFSSNVVDPPAVVYMGKDKYENEDLIKYAWPQDVWFHVDKLSSAHVYLRMPEGMTWDAIPESLLTDCAQLVKANSIEEPKKTGDMAVGQVSFHNDKKQKKADAELAKQREAEKAARSYDTLFSGNDEDEEPAPKKSVREMEEDFM